MQAVTNGIRMHYDVAGPASAPAVVLHHPLATNLSFWDEATAALQGKFRVVRFDARGHGKSDTPAGPYDFETLSRDVLSLMDHLELRRAGFVGLSMGGMIAQHLAVRHGERFSCISIVSASSKTADGMRHLWSERVQAARDRGMASQVEPALQRWLTAANRANRADLVQRCSRMIEATPVEGYAGWCSAIEQLDVTAKLDGIKTPTLVIVGADDPATPVAVSETIQRNIPGAELAIIPTVSHMLAIENPAAFHAELLPFLIRHAT